MLDLIALSDFAVAEPQPFPVYPIQYGVPTIFRALRAQRSLRAIQVPA